MYKVANKIFILFLSLGLLVGCTTADVNTDSNNQETIVNRNDIPAYDGKTYNLELNGGKTYFDDDDMNLSYDYHHLSELDELGRCGYAMAVASKKTIATTERGSISGIRPSGWHTIRYDGIVSEKTGYLYNRSHLLMYKLFQGLFDTNVEENLITGTRFLNANDTYGMLHYEEMAVDYVENSDNHLLYRVTPIFEGDNLIATGVIMEAKSMEDDGKSFEFCVFIYNVQPNEVDENELGVTIDYKTGESHEQTQKEYNALLNNHNSSLNTSNSSNKKVKYVLNTNSKKIHKPSCSAVKDISTENKKETTKNLDSLLSEGYTGCKICNPTQ